jgi:hypothetical protein
MLNGVFPAMVLGSRISPTKRNGQTVAQIRAIYAFVLENIEHEGGESTRPRTPSVHPICESHS